MTQPTYLLQIAFGSAPLAATPAWTDCTAWLDMAKGFQVRRGRTTAFDTVQPGTFTFTLDNHDGRFTPGRVASPYYPNVKVGRRVRLTLTWAGTAYVLFDGFLQSWPLTYENGFLPYITVTAYDALKVLGQQNSPAAYEAVVLGDSPGAYWPLNEPGGYMAGDRTNSGTPLTIRGSQDGSLGYGFGSKSIVAYDNPNTSFWPGPVAIANPGQVSQHGSYLDVKYPQQIGTSSGGTFETWYQWTASSLPPSYQVTETGPVLGFLYSDGDVSVQYEFAYQNPTVSGVTATYTPIAANFVVYRGKDAGSAGNGLSFPLPPLDNNTHHMVVTVDANSIVTVYIDGQATGSGTLPGVSTTTKIQRMLGGGAVIPTSTGLNSWSNPLLGFGPVIYAQAAVYGYALSAGQVANHYQAGATAFYGELSSDRATRYALAGGVLPANVAAEQGQTAMPSDMAATGATTILANVQAAADAEQGLLYVDGSGVLRFLSRRHLMNQPAAWSVNASTAENVGADLAFAFDDTQLINDLVASRPGGGTQRVVNQASVNDYGTYSPTPLSLNVTSDAEVYDAVAYRVGRYAVPKPRASVVTFDPQSANSLYAKVLPTDLWSRFTLTGLPASAPTPTIDLIVEGILWQVTEDAFTVTYDTSPADLQSYLTLDSATYGTLDGANVLAY